MVKLSIVFGTLNRLNYLKPCIESIRQSARDIPYEIVVVDGGSTDGSLEFLREEDVRLIEQGHRLGAGRAFAAGFAASQGEYVCNLNDDCTVEGDTLKLACDYLDAHPEVGQVAIPFSLPNEPAHVDYVNLWGRKLVYANFGVTRKALGAKLRWWGEVFQYSGDTELSIKIWLENYYIHPLPGGHIIHYQVDDDTRVPNVESHRIGRLYNHAAPPPILRQMGHPTPEIRHGRQPKVKKVVRTVIQGPIRVTMKRKSKLHSNVPGMTLIRYLGEGWQVYGAPTGTAYKFSGGAEFYVDDRDMDFVLNNVPRGHKVSVL